MIVRKHKQRRKIRVKRPDGSIIDAICRGISNIETPKYKQYIGIIPIIKNRRSPNTRSNNRLTIGVYSFNMFLDRNNGIPIIPYIKREDMNKHIRIYMRKKYGITRSNIYDIRYLDTLWGMPIYVMLVKQRKRVHSPPGHNYFWTNQLVMYDNSEPIESIFEMLLSKRDRFLDKKINFTEINAPEITITMRKLFVFLELWYSSIHIEE